MLGLLAVEGFIALNVAICFIAVWHRDHVSPFSKRFWS